MSRFVGPLRLERIEDVSADGRGTWRLLSPLLYISDIKVNGLEVIVRVPEDFVNDLASTPRLPFIYLVAGGIGHWAAITHDWLYTTHQVPREVADDIFHEALITQGVSKAQAWLMWSAVRVGGESSWNAAGADQPVTVQLAIAAAARATS